MTIYIYTEARYTPDEFLDVWRVETFKTLKEAQSFLNKQKAIFINDDSDGKKWIDDWEEPDQISAHLHSGDDEIVMAISVGKI